jgi:hypothetical protein
MAKFLVGEAFFVRESAELDFKNCLKIGSPERNVYYLDCSLE